VSRILITGGSGQLGTALARLDWPAGVALDLPGRAELDLADPASIQAWLAANPPALILHSGAYTAVDKAESEPDLAMRINGDAPGLLAAHAAAAGIPIVHVSTDYVFDGSKPAPYDEEDPTAPLGVYGATKLAGEQAVLASGARAVVLRTAWVLSPDGNNFVKTMLRLGAERDSLGVVADQIGCPTSAHDIALAMQAIGRRLLSDQAAPTGIYHFVNGGAASWHDLAGFVFARAAAAGRKTPQLNAIATADYPTPARRPANSRLDTAKIARDYDIHPPHWHAAIGDILNILLERQTA